MSEYIELRGHRIRRLRTGIYKSFQRLKIAFISLAMTEQGMDLLVINPEAFTLSFRKMKRSLI